MYCINNIFSHCLFLFCIVGYKNLLPYVTEVFFFVTLDGSFFFGSLCYDVKIDELRAGCCVCYKTYGCVSFD